MKSTHSAFTIIELLVVVAIISVLASLLLPSLHRAKALSYQVHCSNTQKQLGTVARLYEDDFNGGMFITQYYRVGTSASPGSFMGGWVSYLDARHDPFAQLRDTGLLRCVTRTSGGENYGINHRYGDGYHMMRTGLGKWPKIYKYGNPANKFQFICSWRTRVDPYSHEFRAQHMDDTVSPAIFLDMHVEMLNSPSGRW